MDNNKVKFETLKKGLKLVGKAIKAGAAKITKVVTEANTETLVKFGIVFGVGIVTAWLIIKFLKDKKKSYHSEKNKTVVDEAIDVNYNDVDKQEKLHPLMKKVKKNLRKDLKPRKNVGNKRVAKARKAFNKAAEKANREETEEEYVERINRKYDQFLKDMAFEDEYAEEINKIWTQEDTRSLRTVWEDS